MGRRPEENQHEQRDRQCRDIACHRRPADDRREGPRRAADDDILRRSGLEPDGIDEHIEEDGNRQHGRRQPVGRHAHQNDREEGQADAEMQSRFAVHPPGGQGTVRRALHLRIDVHLIPLVERGGCACAQRNAEDGGESEDGMDMAGCRKQAAKAGEYHQRHDARLGQRKEVAPVGRDRCGGQHSGRHIGSSPVRSRHIA